MLYRLKKTTLKKLNEQLYLSLFFGLVIWLLMAVLFYSDNNPRSIIIYIIGSIFILPYLYKKQIKPYLKNLAVNVESAYFELKNDKVTFNHFDNVKKFGQEKIEFNLIDIVNLKKAYRKDNSVNKITLVLKDKSKVVVEDFEDMESMVEMLFDQHENLQKMNIEGE